MKNFKQFNESISDDQEFSNTREDIITAFSDLFDNYDCKFYSYKDNESDFMRYFTITDFTSQYNSNRFGITVQNKSKISATDTIDGIKDMKDLHMDFSKKYDLIYSCACKLDSINTIKVIPVNGWETGYLRIAITTI